MKAPVILYCRGNAKRSLFKALTIKIKKSEKMFCVHKACAFVSEQPRKGVRKGWGKTPH